MPLTLVLAVVLATAAYAHTADGSAPARVAGTLACSPVDKMSLVVGNARAATCTYVGEGRRVVQTYEALLPARDGAWAGAPMLVWRVKTAGGESRPSMLDGAFAGDKAGLALRGAKADLLPVGHDQETQILLGANDSAKGLALASAAADR